MIARPVRVYADTSVFGGVFDVEFRATSRAFFDQVEDGRFRRVVSAVVEEEIQPAPAHVRDFYDSMLPLAEPAQVTTEVINLRDAYLDAGIVPPRRSNDALHVALATVSGCSLIVSWNFRDIVHFERIRLYNAINALHGHAAIRIFSPMELGRYDEEGV